MRKSNQIKFGKNERLSLLVVLFGALMVIFIGNLITTKNPFTYYYYIAKSIYLESRSISVTCDRVKIEVIVNAEAVPGNFATMNNGGKGEQEPQLIYGETLKIFFLNKLLISSELNDYEAGSVNNFLYAKNRNYEKAFRFQAEEIENSSLFLTINQEWYRKQGEQYSNLLEEVSNCYYENQSKLEEALRGDVAGIGVLKS